MKGDFRSKTIKRMALGALASRITDADHLERILRDTRPGFRSAVRDHLAPYLKFQLPEADAASAPLTQCHSPSPDSPIT